MPKRLGRLLHIGIAVRDLDEARRLYGDVLGFTVTGEKVLPDRGLRVAFLETGNTKIELLEGMTPESAISKHIEKRGPGIQHLCFAVDDIRRVMDELRADGFELIDREPRPGAEGHLVAFLHPKSSLGVLIEIEENREP